MAYKTIKHVPVPNLKSFGPTKTSYGQKKLENFLLCYVGKWAGAFSWLPQYKCMEILIDLKLAEIFQNGVIYIVFKFSVQKIVNSSF